MARFLNVFFILCLLGASGCKLDHTHLTDHHTSDSTHLPNKTQKPSKTNYSSVSYKPFNDEYFSNQSNIEDKNLTSQSTNQTGNTISWDIDSDGKVDALTDGLLMIRYAFGLRGESLVAGAISAGSPLPGGDVMARVEMITTSIGDIDGDGEVDALTDSLLLLRYLFNLADQSLVNGAVSNTATRNNVNSIQSYLDGYMPSGINNPSTASISGTITFDFIPFYENSDGLNINNTFASPARGVLVEILDNSDNVIAANTTDSNGSFSFVTQRDLELRVRVSAKMLKSTGTTWDVQVFDNTSKVGGEHPLYVTDSSSFTTSEDIIKNLHLPSGRNGQNSGIRSAAPFAILDIIYDSMQMLAATEPSILFPPLELYWSPENNSSSGSVENGDLGSSFFQSPNKIYILGDEDADADEYDRHVVAHEWIHYFEDNFSRSDSLGGSHSQDDRLDMRVAYSEALANALSGVITGDSVYRDSDSFWPYYGWSMDMESNYSYNPGWFNESSIQSIIYDIYDTNVDGVDNIALGFEPIFNTLTSESYIEDDYQISIYSLTKHLKDQQSSVNINKINSLANAQQIYGTGSNGFGETNNGGIPSVLPIYRQITANGSSKQVCYNNSAGVINKLGNRAFLKFDVPASGIYNISLSPAGQESLSLDADLAIHRDGVTVGRDYSLVFNGSSNLYISLTTGNYIIESGVWDPDQIAPLGNYCFNIEIAKQ
ncbi:MAG: hypothetical protein P8I13_02955 [Porticoccaceae bacterium]|nr:hypothetical protein [Porticoccaceae bacterium]